MGRIINAFTYNSYNKPLRFVNNTNVICMETTWGGSHINVT
jgi:hypothetical protein